MKEPVLDILMEAMGHINFAQYMIDRKGITDRVTLDGMVLMNWETYNLSMDTGMKAVYEPVGVNVGESALQEKRPGLFFLGVFSLDSLDVTFLFDFSCQKPSNVCFPGFRWLYSMRENFSCGSWEILF